MKIAMVGQWRGADFTAHLSRAFEQLGHTVVRYGPCFRGHMGVPWGEAERYMDSVVPIDDRFEINAYLFHCDVVVLVDWPEFSKNIMMRGVRRVALIELEGWPWSWKRREVFRPDVAYCAMPFGILEQPYDAADRDHSAEDDGWKWLPGACDPSVHPCLYMDRPYDFAMCATPYNFRPRLCQYLRERGFTVNEGFRNVADYAMAYNTAVATVDSGEGQEFLKWRIFEAAAMGCVVLHTGGELMDWLFQDDVHYVNVRSRNVGDDGRIEPDFDDVERAIRWLKVDDNAHRIATAARHEVLQKHTYRHRAIQILDDLGVSTQ